MFGRKKMLTADDVRQVVYNEMHHVLDDIEWRLAQTRQIASGAAAGVRSIYAEDLNLAQHMITGYTVTANTGAAGAATPGSIAWSNVHVVYNGVDYKCADGYTALRYVYFIQPGTYTSGTSPDVVLTSSATKPTQTVLGATGALLFVNNGGTPFDVIASTIAGVLADGAVDAGALQAGAVTAPKMNTIQHLLY